MMRVELLILAVTAIALPPQTALAQSSVSLATSPPEECNFCPSGIAGPDLFMPSDEGCSAAMARAGTLLGFDDLCAELLGMQGMCCPDGSGDNVGPIPLEILEESGSNWKEGHGKNLIIIRGTSALVSVLASSLLFWMLLKSRDGLTTTYHRVLLGVCVADLCFSVAQIHYGVMVTNEMNYISWNAGGTLASCAAQGFLDKFGYISGLLYSSSLNLYYLAKVVYNKPDSYIKDRIEPFLHAVPVLTGLSMCIAFAAKKNFNDIGQGACVDPAYDPPHCIGYEDGEVRDGFDIPCGRGRGMEAFVLWSQVVIMYSPPLIIGTSLSVMYRYVRRRERATASYGASTLNARSVRASNSQETTNEASLEKVDSETKGSGDKGVIKSITSSLQRTFRSSTSSISNGNSTGADTMSRAVMYRAQAYAAAYLLAWGWPSVAYPLYLSGVWTRETTPLGYLYAWYIMTPLQGLFTLLVYMQPKVMKVKQSSEGRVTWCKAFGKVLKSGVSGS